MAYETLTVGQLKRVLEDFDDELEVVVGSDYGDHAGTVQANFLSEVDVVCLEGSNYSSTGYKIIEHGANDNEALILNFEIME